jgi:hypothetical protein
LLTETASVSPIPVNCYGEKQRITGDWGYPSSIPSFMMK